MKRAIAFITSVMLMFVCMINDADARGERVMPGDYTSEKRQERVPEYIPFALQKIFQPIDYQSDPQVVVIEGQIQKNYQLYKSESDIEVFAKDEKVLLYLSFKQLGWEKVDAINHLQKVFGHVDITYTVKNQSPIARADFQIGNFEGYERRASGEDRSKWFLDEVAQIVDERVKEQFQFSEISKR